MSVHSFSERRIYCPDVNAILTMADAEVDMAIADLPHFRRMNGLRRKDTLILQTVSVTVKTELRANYRHGFTGQLCEVQISRIVDVLSEQRI